MTTNDNLSHPTPSQVMDLATRHARLLRLLFNDPRFAYQDAPTAQVCKIDLEATPTALVFASDFVQNTYVDYVLPFLPPGATRKCKDIANAWAHADPTYVWDWEWDADRGILRDIPRGTNRPEVEFPRLSDARAKELLADLIGRTFMAKKAILENDSDPKARIMMGGAFDFGEDVREATRALDTWPE